MKYLFILLVSISTVAQAQRTTEEVYAITGRIVDIENNPVPFANVALYDPTASTLLAGVASDENGNFELRANAGKYLVKISFLSFQEKTIENIVVFDRDVHLNTISLKPSTTQLNEVVVTGEKSQMELKLDKRVFNVGKDLSNISANASEILDNVPSVTVDVEGNVALRGSQNVRILIDGRPSGLTGISSPDALRQLQGNMIESIEVITNPSSRYDAEGEVGIINIILKKNVNQGFNGSVSVQGGIPENYGGSFNLNYRKNKVNLFSSYSYNYRKTPGRGNSYNRFTEQDTTFSYYQTNKRTRGGPSNNFRVGADYYLNEKNVITASILYRISDGRNSNDFEFKNLDSNEALFSTEFREETEKEPETNIEFALSYKKDFKQNGRSLTTDIKIMDTEEVEMSEYSEGVVGSSITQQRSSNTENERNLLFQSDYIHPLGKNGKLESGVKATSRVLDNKYKVEQLNNETDWEILNGLNDHLIYTENIYAGYLMVGNKFNKTSIQAGLRGEYSDILTEFAGNTGGNHRKYFNLFPSAHISYELNENKSIQLSYSYRISRPGFRELLPFSGYSNSRSVFMGNANLLPEYTHSFETGYLLQWLDGSILSSAYYRKRLGVIQRITLVDSIGFNRIVPINMATQDAYGLEFNLTHSFYKWWRLNSNFNFYRALTKGSYNEEDLSSDTYTFTSRITSKVTFYKKYDFQAGINYRAPEETTQGRTLSMYSVDLGLSRDVLKNRGTITLSVRDLFNSRIRRSIVDSPAFYSTSEFQWNRRQVLLTFNFRINQKKETRKRNEQSEGGMEGEE